MAAIINPCSECGGPVPARRPSATGEHWCSKKDCQNAKQRWNYARRNKVDDLTQKVLIRQLVFDLAHLGRRPCEKCGLSDAVPGWAHRDARNPNGPCFGVGAQGPGLPGGLLDAIHPEVVPS